MIRDGLLKVILIPLLGLFIPFAAGISHYRLPLPELILSLLFFVCTLIISWQLGVRSIGYWRRQPRLSGHVYRKLFFLPFFTAVISTVLFWGAISIWQVLISKTDSRFLSKFLFLVEVIMIIVALIYEIIFLTAEKELDGIVLKQVDRERINAELSILKNELEPHFFFNCLTTLTQLVHTDADKAYHFIHKLSSVYKYFLINKEKDLVTLEEEMDFLENYYYLLKVRFDDSIHIQYELDPAFQESKVPPCTLQVLVENAIKHNFFSEKEPLLVTVAATRNHLVVSNPIRPKIYATADSTRIGLKNLKTRYRHVLNKDIVVQTFHNKFSVKLPILKLPDHD